MQNGRAIRAFDYVNHPYEPVRDALTHDALSVFRAATQAATSRAHDVAAALSVAVAGVEVGTEIAITVNRVEQRLPGATTTPETRLVLEWQATTRPGLFPLMRAELAIYPLTATETQLDFSGRYDPPLGLLGSAVDSFVGRRIAEASVHRFVSDVAAYLRTKLADTSPA